jgi:hypothetical protein
MRDFKALSVIINDFQFQAIAEAVSFVNQHYYKKPAVAFSLDPEKNDGGWTEVELKINECTAIVLHYKDDMALCLLSLEFGRRSLAIAIGADTTSKMQAGLPIQQK